MLVRARAPLRLGLAGGGTDVSPYCDTFGGCVLNCTIDRFATATWEWLPHTSTIIFEASDIDKTEELAWAEQLDASCGLRLHRGVYNRMMALYGAKAPHQGFHLTTNVESPMGSGLVTCHPKRARALCSHFPLRARAPHWSW